MKHEVTKAASMYNYNIKAKHMDTMSSFFASKNFELKTRIPSQQPKDEKNNKKGVSAASKN